MGPEKIEALKSYCDDPGDLNPRATARLVAAVEGVEQSARQAIGRLNELLRVIEGGTPDQVLFALRGIADHAGYSNSATTYVAEVVAYASKVAGIVETI